MLSICRNLGFEDTSMNTSSQNCIPFVYIVDSLSSKDLFEGYSIAMALRDSLNAIGIPSVYTLATNRETFEKAFQSRLKESVNHFNAIPMVHLCMHGDGDGQGIYLTDGTLIKWFDLRNLLMFHQEPLYLCMASCYGINAQSMANAYDSAFEFLVGNTDKVLPSDVTVAYLAFYNHIFYKNATVEQAVEAMRAASGDRNFDYKIGDEIRNVCISLLLLQEYAQKNYTRSSGSPYRIAKM